MAKMLKRKSNLTIDKPNKRVRPIGGEENEDPDASDGDQEDQQLSNQVNVADRHACIVISHTSGASQCISGQM